MRLKLFFALCLLAGAITAACGPYKDRQKSQTFIDEGIGRLSLEQQMRIFPDNYNIATHMMIQDNPQFPTGKAVLTEIDHKNKYNDVIAIRPMEKNLLENYRNIIGGGV